MGKLAERFADWVVVTSDNPRNEDAQSIVEDIVAGIDSEQKVVVIDDRAAAIAWAVANAKPSDTILIAGKGHENYQEIGDKRMPFSDFAVASAAIAAGEVTND